MMVGLIQRISNWIATLTEEDVRWVRTARMVV